MYPAVPLPKGVIARPVDFKLKRGWRFDEAKGSFVSSGGAHFTPPSLPKRARIVYKVPILARSSPDCRSKAEQDLRRYMQMILPASHRPEKYLKTVQAWPCVAEAHLAPEVSLPVEIIPRKQ